MKKFILSFLGWIFQQNKISIVGTARCGDLLSQSVQWLSHVQLFVTPWTAACQASLSITNFWSQLMSVVLVMSSNHPILCHPILLLSSIFPASGSFPMSYFFASGGQSIGFSFSLSPSNEYSWLISFRIDWVDLLCSPRDSQESSPRPQFKSIDCLVLSSLYSPTLTSIHDYWKNHSLH